MSDKLPRGAALGAAVALVLIASGLLIALAVGAKLDETTTPLVMNVFGMIGLAIPILLTAAFAERAARNATQAATDIRNGVLKAQVTAGTHTALREAQVVTRDGPAILAHTAALHAQTAALTAILEQIAATSGTGDTPPGDPSSLTTPPTGPGSTP